MIEYKGSDTNLVFCLVDNTWQYTSAWTRELIKNQSDFCITNITRKGYTVLQGIDEDKLLQTAAKKYNYAVVFSTGTEFVYGYKFFEEIAKECTENFLVKGHILDRGNAYYELHHQCYLVNLDNYRNLDMPSIGKQELGSVHQQTVPIRSKENIHDNYTPTYVQPGLAKNTYHHKMHGWNILNVALSKYKVTAFNDKIRSSKKHYYPENQTEFLKHSDWIYKRENYCAKEFVHTSATDWSNGDLNGIEQVVTPASGDWWKDYIADNCKVLMYDYNQASINYWQEQYPDYNFVLCDFLCDSLDLSRLDPSKKTFINLSNIYAYEGTTFTHSLEKRLQKETEMLDYIKQTLPNAIVSFSARACSGFVNCEHYGPIQSIKTYTTKDLICPTWHANGDWHG